MLNETEKRTERTEEPTSHASDIDVGPPCVVQPWVFELPAKGQVAVFAAIRGPDHGTRLGQELTRRLRWATLHNADKKSSFMSSELNRLDLAELEYRGGSMHFLNHLYEAGKKISRRHPLGAVRDYWTDVTAQLEQLCKIGK